jgi:hypothetical protein
MACREGRGSPGVPPGGWKVIRPSSYCELDQVGAIVLAMTARAAIFQIVDLPGLI